MLNASHYHVTETLPNGLRLLIRATEPHDDIAGAIQRKVSPTSFFYRFLRPKHYLTDKDVASFVHCDFVSQVGLIGLVRDNLRMAIIAGARYWITRPDEAEIAFIVADAYQKPRCWHSDAEALVLYRSTSWPQTSLRTRDTGQ
jgi:hypothetical protein